MSNDGERPPAVAVMGPTASGKTALAERLVAEFPFAVISVDSVQVYRGMDVGTAKPTAEERARTPHRLVDIREPSEPYSAADFRADALAEMADITAAGGVPLLVGGTMLYFRALFEGLSRLPAADAGLRRRLEAEGKENGWAAMHRRLAAVDPAAAERIHPNDPQRIQRALEVIELTGQPLTAVQDARPPRPLPWRVLKLVVAPRERAELHHRIERRFTAMMAAGFLDEVRALREGCDLDPGLPALRSVGYRQAWAHLDGACDEAEMVRRAVAATRQLAKRQLTWLRREEGALWYDLAVSGTWERVRDKVRRFLELPS